MIELFTSSSPLPQSGSYAGPHCPLPRHAAGEAEDRSQQCLIPSGPLTCDPSEVHLWRVEANPANYEVLKSAVSEAEYRHAQRFPFPANRCEFIVARGLMRVVLASYLGISPDALRFPRGQHGKPELEPELWSSRRFTFNLSHSRGLVLLAIGVEQEVGIDVEYVSPDFDFTDSASMILSPAEESWLLQSPRDQRQPNFFRCWTRKEAFAKGLGEGLSDRIRLLEVIPSNAQLVPRIDGVPEDHHWTLRDLELGDGFVGAVAVARDKCSFRFWDWPA